MRKSDILLTIMILSLIAVSSCREKTTGEKIKDDVEEIGEDIKDGAEKAGDNIEKAAKDTKDALKEAGEDIKEAVDSTKVN